MATKDQRITARYLFAVTTGENEAPVRVRLNRYQEGAAKLGDEVSAQPQDGLVAVEILPWVSDVRWDRTPATRLRYPAGGVVVQRRGVLLREVTLSGEVGPYPQRFPDVRAQGANSAFSSPINREIEKRLENEEPIAESVERLEKLDRLFDQVAASGSRLRLHLYAINENAYWEVEPLRMSGSRIRSMRTGWSYAFHFRILREVKPPAIDAVAWAAPTFVETNPLKLALAAVRTARAAVGTAIALVQAGVAWLNEEAIGPVFAMIDESFGIVEDLTALSDEVSEWFQGLVHSPVDIWNRMRLTAGRWTQIAADLEWSMVGSWERAWGLGGGSGEASLDRLEDSAPMRDLLGGLAAATVAVDSSELALLLAAHDAEGRSGWAIVRPGDTLERIALRHLGDPERADELRALNRLVYPYVTEVRVPGTVIPGDQLRVPLQASGRPLYFPSLTTGPASRRAAKLARMGRDLSVVRRSDRLFDWALKGGSTGESGRAGVATVDGEAAFEQNLTKRLETEYGTNPLFPQRGIPAAIGILNTAQRQGAYVVGVTQELRADDRVSEVRDLVFTQGGATLGFEATIGLVEGTEIPVPTRS